MAIALQPGPHRVAHRPRWVREQRTEPSRMLAGLMLALLAAGIATVMLSAQAFQGLTPTSLGALMRHTTPTRPTDGAAPPGRRATVAMATTSAATPGEAALPAPVALSAPPSSEAAGASQAAASPQAATSAQTAAPASGLVAGQRARVAHTDGMGVVLHSAPNKSARRPAGLLEGAPVTVLELADGEWARVQADNRQTGWVPAAFLAGE